MKEKVAKLLIFIYVKIIWRQPCVLYRRRYKYDKNNINGFRDKCPFCIVESWMLVEQYSYWIIVKNKYPYPYTKQHFLLCPKRHIVWMWELSQEEIFELNKIVADYMEQWYLLLGRQHSAHKDSSVEHLHLHLIY